METLFKIIFFFILIGYLFKLFFRYALPYILKRKMEKMMKNMENSNFGDMNGQYQQPKREEGDVKIDHVPNKKKQKSNDLGDYVDFEETN